MIEITDKAKDKIVSLRNEEGKSDEHNIRVSVKGGGCSGLMYDLTFDQAIEEGDQTQIDLLS